MKTVQLKRLVVTNFKGARKLDIPFNEKTSLYGANGTYKSTTYDAFLWLLFGKNADDKKDFSIKNTVEKELNRQDHEVEAIMVIDGEENTLKRVYKEKWEKKKGEEFSRMTGNETVYFWNGVPMPQKDFVSKINSVLEESVFKLITNPLAFNDIKWQDRRSLLTTMFGDVSNEELAKGNSEYEELVSKLTQGKTLSDYQKQILAEVKKSKDELKAIPTRIDEVSKSIPETLDFNALRTELDSKDLELKHIDKQIQDKSAAFDSILEAHRQKQMKAHGLKADISTIEITTRKTAKDQVTPDETSLMLIQNTITDKTQELKSAENTLSILETKVSTCENEIASTTSKMDAKRNEWNAENAKTAIFDENEFCCPTCKRNFESEDVETKKTEMLSTFNANKTLTLNTIMMQGQSLANETIALETELNTLKSRIENGKKLITDIKKTIEKAEADLVLEKSKHADAKDLLSEEDVYNDMLSKNILYQEKKAELVQLEEQMKEVPKVDIDELKSQRNQIISEIDQIKTKLQIEAQITQANSRIEALKQEESNLAQIVANTEKTQFTIERFEKLKMESLEQKVNSKFQMVKFRMFDQQVNGGESPACEILVNGVPFSDANTASRINAGLDIINVLCDYYQVSAPIFIDNRESVVEIIDTNSQIINLIVSEKDKTLRVA